MASLASSVEWGNSPSIYFGFSYEKKRDGATQYYKITVNCQPCYGDSFFGYPIYLEIKLDGTTAATTTLKEAVPDRWYSTISYTTGWLPVKKGGGTTALAIRIYSGSGSSRNTTYSYSLAVDPATSKISATDANIESTSVITITRYDTSFTTTVGYKAAGQSGYTTIWTKQAHTSYAWTVPSSLYSLIPGDREIAVELRCQTYSGNTLVGTEYASMMATTSQTKCAPSVSVSSADVSAESLALTGNNKTIVNGISKLRVVTSATAKNSATISTITAYCGANSLPGADVTFNAAGSKDVYVIVTDSRGYSTRVDDKTLSFVSYIAPTVNPTVTRDTPTGDTVSISVHGIWFNGSFGAVDNTIRVRVAYKVADSEAYGDYTDATVTMSSNNYTASLKLSGLAYTKAYKFKIRLDDEVYTDTKGYRAAKIYYDLPLSKGIPVFDWGESDFAFNVPVKINGTLTIGGQTITEAQLASLLKLIK